MWKWIESPSGVQEVMGSIPVGDSDFLCPMLVSCRLTHLSHLLLSTKFTIFIHLSLLIMTLTVLILAVCREPVTYELNKKSCWTPQRIFIVCISFVSYSAVNIYLLNVSFIITCASSSKTISWYSTIAQEDNQACSLYKCSTTADCFFFILIISLY